MIAINLYRKGRASHAQNSGRRLDLHRPGRAAGDVARNHGEGSLPHIGQHRTAEIIRIELEFVEGKLAVRAGREDRVVDKSDADPAVRAGFDDVLFEERIAHLRGQTPARALDYDLPGYPFYFLNPSSIRCL